MLSTELRLQEQAHAQFNDFVAGNIRGGGFDIDHGTINLGISSGEWYSVCGPSRRIIRSPPLSTSVRAMSSNVRSIL